MIQNSKEMTKTELLGEGIKEIIKNMMAII